ncbi:hypothetical protein [Deinococcus sonorensis]|uniref:Uncharacterized protein n=2 Tax=Deinococcus sonorensis TaxID=309891 RepID=A0AAU7U5F5_9DEIO
MTVPALKLDSVQVTRRAGRLLVALTLLAIHGMSLVHARAALQPVCPLGSACTQPVSSGR